MFLLSLYINNVLEQLNKLDKIHVQAYADDIIILNNDINMIQKAYDKAKELLSHLDLEINPSKCELISENENDSIFDKENNTEKLEIKSKR